MFVVRIENDEALMFKAFARWADAKMWSLTRLRSSDDDILDVYDLQNIPDAIRAVESCRDGGGRHVSTGEKLLLEDFRQSSSFLAGMGIGTGAGF